MSPTLLALAVTVSAPALKDKPPPGPPLVGRWTATQLVSGGQPNEQWMGLEYEFTADGRWVIYREGRPIDGTARTYTVDGSAIDLSEARTPYPGRFALEKATLTLCFEYGGGRRPADIKATGPGIMTVVLTRDKD